MPIQLSFLLFFIALIFSNCSIPSKFNGTWVVKNVKVGSDIMTPMGKWVKFQKNHTQTSGNGWVQHTVGTWQFNNKTSQLAFLQTNGFKDEHGPFSLKIGKDEMVWKREEEGQKVEVTLLKTDIIPQAPPDKLLGVWDLEKTIEEEEDISSTYDPNQKRYLFLKWDKIFTIQHTPQGRIMGIYKTHGHKQEVQFVYYSDPPKIETWQYEVNENKLVLNGVISGKKMVKEYRKIDHFPQ